MSAARQDAILFEVLRHRLWAINDEAATTIARVSGSPVANESYDFNTALMDGDGNVVVIGAYVMAHACALDRVVRYVIDEHSDNPDSGRATCTSPTIPTSGRCTSRTSSSSRRSSSRGS